MALDQPTATDEALLFSHYAADDLWSAGASAPERFFSPTVDPTDKWSIIEPACRQPRVSDMPAEIAPTGFQSQIVPRYQRLASSAQ